MQLRAFPPAIILTTERGLKDWQAGATRGPVVVIRPGREADAGLLAHELVHVRHWWLYGLLATALIALVGLASGTVEIGGLAFPAWSIAPIGLGANSLAYAAWPEWRAAEEIAAYREQARHYADDRRPLFAEFIAGTYGLDITAAEALQRLREG